ncbi:DoxX family protein [Aquimarina mytili]|uniref:DoxX family protein n=1 Tax=Aquimarina mytili TaxID=874423 RepID=A0A936ZUW0_9FLAO|nr:DoxX family protein [Aquimarina mytili]MBL0684757.1 DoxX family protein [Aquimarina mytili]
MKNKILLVVTILFGLMMLNSGASKFTNHMPAIEMPEAANELIQAMIASGWLFALVGIVEIVGGILFALPKYRALGAIIIFPITVGIFLFNIFLAPANAVMGIILLIINVWVLWENRNKYSPMWSSTKI